MKALIVGYGSMGKRRIRILKKLVSDISFICVDSNEERQTQIEKDGYISASSVEKAINMVPDIAFVCTSPGHHSEIILQLLKGKINVFTELNLVDTDYEKMIQTAKEKEVVIFMSSSLLYNKQRQKISELVRNEKKPVTYVYHVGQYLPDWHPWESYKDFFIGKKETNGVREIYAIQMPWVIHTFGKIDYVSAARQKCTDLDIEFNDSIVATFKHENGNIGVFVADTVSRKAVRNLEVISENLHLFWGGHNDDLFVYDPENKETKSISAYETVEQVEGYSDNIIENQYSDEIQDFLDAVYKGSTPKYSLEQDKYVLSIIDEIEGRENKNE